MSSADFATLLLCDTRFPSGAHAHSFGVEAAVADGRVRDEASLAEFAFGQVSTVGLTDAAIAAGTVTALESKPDIGAVSDLDEECSARIIVPRLREASQKLGRQLQRSASRCWPHSLWEEISAAYPAGLHVPVTFGTAAWTAGMPAEACARASLYCSVAGATTAAVRLCGLDPFAVTAVSARLAEPVEQLVREAQEAATQAPAALPAPAAPLIDLAAVDHGRWDSRLFAT